MTLAARMVVIRAHLIGRKAARERHAALARELAAYATPSERADLEAALERYPPGATREIRAILARQAMAAHDNRWPAIGRS